MSKRPNLIYVMPDQFRQQGIGNMNADPVLTPNLDNFCKESMVLENAISNFPVCSPYRGMLFTGKYPYSTGVISNCNSNRNGYGVYLKKTERCISDVLSENGYDLGYIGKWHLDPTDPSQEEYTEGYRNDGVMWDTYTLPSRRHNFNFWYSYGACDRHLDPHYWLNEAKIEERIRPNEWSVKHETDVAINYIENRDGKYRDENKPFALVVAYNPPHPPFNEVPQKYVDMYEGKSAEDLLVRENLTDETPEEFLYVNRKPQSGLKNAKRDVKDYFAAITGVDENFGRILKAIDEKGLKEDTIVIFTSDHGEMMGSHNLSGKPHWYAESFKVPFIIRYTEKVKPCKTDFILNVPDIMPTLLGMMGLEDKIPNDVEGEDKSEYFYGLNDGETVGLYLNPHANMRGLKTKQYTFIVARDYVERENYILYDDINDPYQLKNIAAEKVDIVKELRIKLDEVLANTKDIWNK